MHVCLSRLAVASLAFAAGGCGSGSPAAPRVLGPPLASSALIAGASAGGATQAFAATDGNLVFRDPDRSKKLRAAFPRIDEIAADELTKQDLPSIAIGVVIDGELAYSNGYGFADLAAKTKPDLDTVYRIGSITKSFTSAALLSLRDEGLVSLDDSLAKWIPDASGIVYPTRDSPPITLRQLLTHTSGLPRDATVQHVSTTHAPSEEELTKSLANLSVVSAPGTEFAYSNLGFALLGVVAGHVARAPVRELVNRRLLTPLGMTSTAWERSSVANGRLATAYVRDGAGQPKPTDHWRFGALEGAGGLYSSVRDLARYVAFQLSAYPPRSAPDNGPLKRSSVREAHFNALRASVDAILPLSVRLAGAPRKGESLVEARTFRYGYGWGVAQTCEFDDVVWHVGITDGFQTEIAFLPEQGVGVIALTNLRDGSPQPIVERSLLALLRTGALSKRTRALPPAFGPAMENLLRVYNQWDDATYAAMLRPGRTFAPVEERAELEGYKKLHGACKGYSVLDVRSDFQATFLMDCERGHLEMDVDLAGPDRRIDGFGGRSRDLPIPPDLRRVGERFMRLVQKWDESVFKKQLAKTKRSHDETVRSFAELRARHGACALKSMSHFVFDTQLIAECERGGDVALRLVLDPKDPESVTAYSIESNETGACPMR